MYATYTLMYMKNKKNINKKLLIILVVIIILLIGATCYYFFVYKPNQDNTSKVSYDAPTSNELTGETTTEQTESGQENTSDSTTDTNSNQSNVKTTSPYSVSISSLNQDESYVMVRALISPLVSGGHCTLTLLSSSGKKVTKMSAVQATSSSATCQGFNVAKSELSSGTWTASITYTSTSNVTSTADSESISI